MVLRIECPTEMESARMKALAAPVILAVASIVSASASAAPTHSPAQSARSAALYPIPPALPSTPTASVRVSASNVVSALTGMTPVALAAKGAIEFDAVVSGPGTLEFVLTAKLHGKTVVIGKDRETVRAAGRVAAKIALTGAAKAALARRKGQLRVTVSVVLEGRHGGQKTASAVAMLK
jgi:hypothetical protein